MERQDTFVWHGTAHACSGTDLSPHRGRSDVLTGGFRACFLYILLGWLGVMVLLLTPGSVSAEEDLQALAIVSHGKQLLAFSSLCNCWDSVDLLGSERTLEHESGARVAVAVTNVRVLGFSAETGKWDQVKLKGSEELLSLEAKGNVAVVETNLRALGFGSPKGRWVEALFYLK